MLPAGVIITNIRDTPYITPGNTTGTQTTYTWTYNGRGPFTLTLAGSDNTPENVAAKIQARVNGLISLGVQA